MADPLLVFYRDMQAAYLLSSTKENKAISAAYGKLADSLTPIVPPTSSFPLTLTNNPTGSKKTNPKVTNGDLTITASTDNVQINGIIHIKASNVTLTNFVCKGIVQDPGLVGAVISDGIIKGDGTTDGYQWNNATISRVECTFGLDGFKAHGDTHIDQCWFHDDNFQTFPDGTYTHSDAVQISSGNNVSIMNCRVENWRGNSGFFPKPDQGTISNVEISGNYLTNTGNYPIYCLPTTQYGTVKNLTITNNTIGKRRTDTDISWGPMYAHIETDTPTLKWSNNIDQISGKQIFLNAQGEGYLGS